MKSIIQVLDVSFSYDKEIVLENISLEIQKSDFLAIIGPNGGGKSTFLKLLLGILTPTKGTIKIFEKKPEESYLELGYVPQDTDNNKNFPINVLDVVLQGRVGISKNFWGFSKKDIQICLTNLEKVGLRGFEKRKLSQLSGGQRQRVFIARALSTEANILLLDEPTASIDSKGQIELYSLLKELNKYKCIICVSHNVNVILGFANKVAYINKTLYLHNSPAANKAQILQKIAENSAHICPIELMVDQGMCLHTRNEERERRDENDRDV